MIAVLAAQSLAAQQAAGNDAGGALKRAFDDVMGNVTKSAEMVPADKYSYKPTASVRTFAQLIGHIADSHNYYCARAAGQAIEWADPVEKGGQDKATLLQKLKQSNDRCVAIYNRGGQFPQLVDNVGHTNLHYGNIITYLRMLGMVPPSS
jgi:uncharacterized damage-inducible protein DinB